MTTPAALFDLRPAVATSKPGAPRSGKDSAQAFARELDQARRAGKEGGESRADHASDHAASPAERSPHSAADETSAKEPAATQEDGQAQAVDDAGKEPKADDETTADAVVAAGETQVADANGDASPVENGDSAGTATAATAQDALAVLEAAVAPAAQSAVPSTGEQQVAATLASARPSNQNALSPEQAALINADEAADTEARVQVAAGGADLDGNAPRQSGADSLPFDRPADRPQAATGPSTADRAAVPTLPSPVVAEASSSNAAAPAPATPSAPATPTPDAGALAQQFDAPNPTDAQNAARVARGLRSAINQHGGALTLRLDPPELGAVRIVLDVNQGTVRAQLAAESASVRDLLNHQLTHLRHALESQGLTVERLEVTTGQSSQQSSFGQHNAHDQGRSRGWTGQQRQSGQSSESQDDAQEPETFEQAVLNTIG